MLLFETSRIFLQTCFWKLLVAISLVCIKERNVPPLPVCSGENIIGEIAFDYIEKQIKAFGALLNYTDALIMAVARDSDERGDNCEQKARPKWTSLTIY